MRNHRSYRTLFILTVVVILMGLPYLSAAAMYPVISVTDDDLREVVSISTADGNRGTVLTVKSVGKMTMEKAMFLDEPPRMIYDLFYDGPPFASVTRSVNNQYLASIRIGYHPNKIRLVLDAKGSDIPKFTHQSGNKELIIALEVERKGPVVSTNQSGGRTLGRSQVSAVSASSEAKVMEVKENNGSHETESIPADSAKAASPVIIDASVTDTSGPKDVFHQEPSLLPEKMMPLDPDDGSEERALFLKAIEAFKHQRWPESEKSLKHLIKTYPNGRYSEKAYFLLAKSVEQLHSETPSEHFSVIKSHYEDAISKFPESIFVPDALLSVGNLFLKVKSDNEAIGYFNLVIEKKTDDIARVKAMIQKGNLLFQKGKYAEALSVYERIIQNFSGSFVVTEAEIGAAKALFEMNSFDKSIKLLTWLAQKPENIYLYPDISLYLGYNYYQKKDYAESRKNLFRYYNIRPDSETCPLALTKIGDSYRAERLLDAAKKIYQLVLTRFPQTEGALISLTRLAEEQESGERKIMEGIPVPINITGEAIDSPQNIYEEVIRESIGKNNNSPMVEYALLKLAVIYRKEKSNGKSLDILKDLLEKYPQSKLLPEIIYALSETFEAVLEDQGEEEYIKILNIYQKQQGPVQRLAPPKTFIAVAKAYQRLGFEDMAAELFLKADALLPAGKKPEELLFCLGKYYFEKGQNELGLEQINSLVTLYPAGEYSAKAYHVKGGAFQKNKEYTQAIELFSLALKSRPKTEDRINILVDKARALMSLGLNEEGLAAARDAEQSLSESPEQNQSLYLNYQRVGDLYLDLGRPAEALSLLNTALSIEKNEKKSIKLKFSIARCYEAMNKKSDYIPLYTQLAGLDDPVWSLVAKEKLEAIDFEAALKKANIKKNKK